MAKRSKYKVGQEVVLRGTITKIIEDPADDSVTIVIPAYGRPITLRASSVDLEGQYGEGAIPYQVPRPRR